ncbi:MAG: GNAT family N-acetyltransferase [Planctomycetaceae bacterium]
MNSVAFPDGFHLATLERRHRRNVFDCGEPIVNDWLQKRALQNQAKHLSTTRVLLRGNDDIVGFYTLATGQVDFGDLPTEFSRGLPRRALPIAILAWLGVDQRFHGSGLGDRLLAQSLRDCHTAGETFAFIAVVIDCINEQAKNFYQRWSFQELPGSPYRLFLNFQTLNSMMKN